MLVTVCKVKFTLWRHCSANICLSSRRPQDVFKTCLEDIFGTSSAWQFFVFQGVFERSWRRLEDIFWRPLEDPLKTCLEDIFKTSWRQTKCLLGYLYLTNLNLWSTNLCLANLYLINLRRIKNALIRFQ